MTRWYSECEIVIQHRRLGAEALNFNNLRCYSMYISRLAITDRAPIVASLSATFPLAHAPAHRSMQGKRIKWKIYWRKNSLFLDQVVVKQSDTTWGLVSVNAVINRPQTSKSNRATGALKKPQCCYWLIPLNKHQRDHVNTKVYGTQQL